MNLRPWLFPGSRKGIESSDNTLYGNSITRADNLATHSADWQPKDKHVVTAGPQQKSKNQRNLLIISFLGPHNIGDSETDGRQNVPGYVKPYSEHIEPPFSLDSVSHF